MMPGNTIKTSTIRMTTLSKRPAWNAVDTPMAVPGARLMEVASMA